MTTNNVGHHNTYDKGQKPIRLRHDLESCHETGNEIVLLVCEMRTGGRIGELQRTHPMRVLVRLVLVLWFIDLYTDYR